MFTPTAAYYHLYSLDLPPGGVDGIGRPVSLKLRGGLEQTARPTTGAAVHDLQLPGGLPPVPVYPDGPVTVTLPVHRTAEGPATVLVGYAACSETKGCLFPVDAHPVEATVDGTSVRFAAPARPRRAADPAPSPAAVPGPARYGRPPDPTHPDDQDRTTRHPDEHTPGQTHAGRGTAARGRHARPPFPQSHRPPPGRRPRIRPPVLPGRGHRPPTGRRGRPDAPDGRAPRPELVAALRRTAARWADTGREAELSAGFRSWLHAAAARHPGAGLAGALAAVEQEAPLLQAFRGCPRTGRRSSGTASARTGTCARPHRPPGPPCSTPTSRCTWPVSRPGPAASWSPGSATPSAAAPPRNPGSPTTSPGAGRAGRPAPNSPPSGTGTGPS
ncbi:hypothetical protein ACFQ1I_14870 [Kitasatospora arboriphila]